MKMQSKMSRQNLLLLQYLVEQYRKQLSQANNDGTLWNSEQQAKVFAKKVDSSIKNALLKEIRPSGSLAGELPHILVRLILDPKNTWKSNIWQNARNFTFYISPNGTIDLHSAYPRGKFRKTKCKSPQEAGTKIDAFLKSMKDVFPTQWSQEDIQAVKKGTK